MAIQLLSYTGISGEALLSIDADISQATEVNYPVAFRGGP